MAIIQTAQARAEVQAQGEAMSARVNLSGALMEMLASTYAYPALAAVRESIQNACDAASRAGKTFREGVLVTLPTLSDPVFTVEDLGDGMSKEFMEGMYLSFGSSTKSGDNTAAGGFGIGRWAAFGFARECTIATTDKADLVQRTYFQFPGADGVPKVQFAGEMKAERSGTKVSFPVAQAGSKVFSAVRWISEVMQITMGDTFTVTNPGALPDAMLPAVHTEFILDLGEENPALQGVRVYPMQGRTLCFDGTTTLSPGSLLVQTNQERHVGGLSFHSKVPDLYSVFSGGVIIEVPLSIPIPFMPSREEVKYNDDFQKFCDAVNDAAFACATRRVQKLLSSPSWADLKACSAFLLGLASAFSYTVQNAKTSVPVRPARCSQFHKDIENLIFRHYGSNIQNVLMRVGDTSAWQPLAERGLAVRRLMHERHGVIRQASVWVNTSTGDFATASKDGYISERLKFNQEVVLICQDTPDGGQSRLRAWLGTQGKQLRDATTYVLNSKETADVFAAARLLRETFRSDWRIIKVSALPEVERAAVVTKKGTVRARRGEGIESVQFYRMQSNAALSSADRCDLAFDDGGENLKVYFSRATAGINGLKGAQVRKFLEPRRPQVLCFLRESMGLPKTAEPDVFVLSTAQREKLVSAQRQAREDDPKADDAHTRSLMAWVPFERLVLRYLESGDRPLVLAGQQYVSRIYDPRLTMAVTELLKVPRLSLSVSRFGKDLLPYADVLNGTETYSSIPVTTQAKTEGIAAAFDFLRFWAEAVGDWDKEVGDLSEEEDERLQALITRFKEETNLGIRSDREVWDALLQKYPLCGVLSYSHLLSPEAIRDLCESIALLYR